MKWDFWFRRRRWEDRMHAEMQFHLESQIEDYVSQGLSREAAERRARREFGALELTKDECRDQQPAEWLAHLLRDVRYSARSLGKNPGFAAAAILTVALGIGANTAIFSVVYSVLLKPLPYSAPDDIYRVEIVIPERRAQFDALPVTVQAYLEWRKADTAFSDMAALTPWECNLTGDGEPERLGGAKVTTNFFAFLGAPIALGRGFLPEEEQPGRDRVVVISDALWRTRYGSNPAVIRRSVDINGKRYAIVGVAGPSVLVPTGAQFNSLLPFAPRIDVWKPIAPTAQELKNESWDHGVLARIGPGQNPERGRQQLQSILNRFMREQMPNLKTEVMTKLSPVREIYAGKVRFRLLLVFAASTLVLLIACANLANLFLARVASRAGELATRMALGAGRARILSQTLAETGIVALLGGSLGALIAAYGSALLFAYGPDDVRLLAGTRVSALMFLFAFFVSLVTGVVCSIFPSRHAYRSDLRPGLERAARTGPGGRAGIGTRRLLVGSEVALGTALLVCAGLLLHSFINVVRADRGYQIERVLAVDLSLFGQRYDSGESRTQFYRDLADRVRAIPGVMAAGTISDLPATAGSSGASRTIFHPTDTDYQGLVLARPVAMVRSVTTGYFSASGTPLRAGRFLADHESTLVAVISESLAKSLWPREEPAKVVGAAFRQGNVTGPLITIVGIVGDVRGGSADTDPPPIVYRPHEQWASGPATLVVRTAQEPAAVASAVRAAIREMDANLPISALRTMREIISTAVSQRRFQMLLISLFGVVALLLGAVGVYGVVSYSVACRTRDIGLRIALGAMEVDVIRWVLSDGMRPVLAGLCAGLIGAVAVARTIQSQLFGVGTTDPIAFAGVALLLLLTSALACYIPARRAARLDAIVALRNE